MTNIPKIRFKAYTSEWEKRQLDQIADIVGGGTPSTTISEYWDGDIDWYAPAEIGDQRFVDGSIRKITKLGLQNCSATILPAGKTILFTSRAGIGKTAILRHPGATNQGFQSLVLKDGYNPYCIYSMSSRIKEKAEAIASGSTFLEISGKMLGNIDITLPNKPEQDKIASFFEYIDDLITSQQRKYEKLVVLKSACLAKMFPKGEFGVPSLRFHGFYSSWEKGKLDDLAQVKDSARVPNALWTSFGVPYIRASDVSNNNMTGVLFLSEESYNYYRALTGAPQKGDVLFNGGGDIGKSYHLATSSPIYAQGGAVLYAKTSESDTLDGLFLKYYFETDLAKRYIEMTSAGGTMKHFTLKPAQEMMVLKPKIEEQKKIGQFLANIDNAATLQSYRLIKLQQFKQAILHNMFV